MIGVLQGTKEGEVMNLASHSNRARDHVRSRGRRGHVRDGFSRHGDHGQHPGRQLRQRGERRPGAQRSALLRPQHEPDLGRLSCERRDHRLEGEECGRRSPLHAEGAATERTGQSRDSDQQQLHGRWITAGSVRRSGRTGASTPLGAVFSYPASLPISKGDYVGVQLGGSATGLPQAFTNGVHQNLIANNFTGQPVGWSVGEPARRRAARSPAAGDGQVLQGARSPEAQEGCRDAGARRPRTAASR